MGFLGPHTGLQGDNLTGGTWCTTLSFPSLWKVRETAAPSDSWAVACPAFLGMLEFASPKRVLPYR